MFCFQCEQTAKGEGCSKIGVCGKQPEVAALQDLLRYAIQGLSQIAVEGRKIGVIDNEIDRPLRVVLVSTERRWQGGEEQARQLARGLRQLGHRCYFAALRGGALAQRVQQEGFEVFDLAGRLAWPHRCWQLRRQLRRKQIDVVHFNDSRAITVGGLSAWRLPDTVTVAARRASFPIRSAARYNQLCDRVFCVSTHVAKLCLDAGITEDRLRVVHDGVDPRRMTQGLRERGRRELGIGDDDQLLLAVGSLVACKGHRHLIEAMPAVLKEVPQAQLVIAGEGVLADELRQLIADRRLDRHACGGTMDRVGVARGKGLVLGIRGNGARGRG